VANVVVVPKKDGKIRVCMDYRYLNKASSNDGFPLPHRCLCWQCCEKCHVHLMDRFSRYNHIRMAKKDKEKTTFVTP
jgi:ferredoxin